MLHEMDGFVLRDKSLAYNNEGTMVPATRAAIVTALLLQIGTWPADEQKQFLAAGLATLNNLLADAANGESHKLPNGNDINGSTGDTTPEAARPKRRNRG